MPRPQGRDEPTTSPETPPTVGAIGRAILPPLALAQFLSSFANTLINVSISAITQDLGTTVTAVQTSITLFTLIMAMFMITGSKLTDIWGRKRTFRWGVGIFATGSAVAALSPNMGLFVMGNSVLQGFGSGLLIPPIYILITVSIDDLRARAAAFGIVGGMGGLGTAAGPLIGGMITTAISWRATYASPILLAIVILILSRRIRDVPFTGPKPSLGTAVAGGVLVSALILGVTSLTQASQTLPPAAKERIAVAMQGDISALSDTQVRAALQGQPAAIVDEVVRINAEARDRALGLALASIGLVGLIGLGASLRLPSDALLATPEANPPPGRL